MYEKCYINKVALPCLAYVVAKDSCNLNTESVDRNTELYRFLQTGIKSTVASKWISLLVVFLLSVFSIIYYLVI